MYNIEISLDKGVLIISDTYDVLASMGTEDATPYLNNIDDEYIINISNIQNVVKYTKFSYDTLGINSERYLSQYYRISKNGTSWSNWLDLNDNIDNFPKIDPKDNLDIELKWVRKGRSTIGSIRILEWKLEGEVERNQQSLSDSTIILSPGETKILISPFIFKVFKITDIEIIPDINPNDVEIKYRFSQDSTRTWSEWELFTKENITTVRINPVRFFQIEYSIYNKYRTPIKINDINIIGDFHNVNKDYQKSNLFGIRECCSSNQWGYFDANGNYYPNTNLDSAGGQSCDSNVFKPMTSEEKSNLYNPYAQNTAVKLLEKLSADSEQVFGHKVTYFATDADKNGQDHILNEYQLYNVVCQGDLKVSIEGNNFPDSQIKMNIFDLDLFDTMEAHVTKQQFKQIFGVQRRPSKEDFLYFCQVNRMYQVDHAQQFRGFNNSAVYYKIILKKYNQKSNVKADNQEIKNQLDRLTRNTTIDQLFGIEQSQDKLAIANKEQTAPLTRDAIRLEYFAEIDRELIENSSTIISKSNYDLSSLRSGDVAVRYINFNPELKVSDNISLQIWFNIHNYMKDEVYNFMSFYDEKDNLGWESNLVNDEIVVRLNNDTYAFNLLGYESNADPSALDEDVWYCYVLNINQRQRNIEQFIYKRDVDDEEDAPGLMSTVLRKIYYEKNNITPIEYQIQDNNITPTIISSDMKVTNIRLFSDVMPESTHNKLLNQYIIGDDSKYLIFADSANTRLYLPRFPLN
jgi:hypothetical protein